MIETKSVFQNYQYVVLFDENFGYRCGYVGIPKGHKLYKKHYSYIDCDCHGGLTFSDFNSILGEDLWCIGFDCNHGLDGIDLESCKKYGCKDLQFAERMYEIKKDFKFMDLGDCVEECKQIINQIIRFEKEGIS